MNNIVVNALGDACPIPVVKTIKALDAMTEPGIVEVHVDNEAAVQNVTRLGVNRGYKVGSEKADEKHFVIRMEVATIDTAPSSEEEACCAPDRRGNTVVAFDTNCMGRGNDELGATLMKGFIYALSQLEVLPKTLLFYNGGAKLTTQGSASLEDLKSMEAQGVEILTCGTCLNFYGLTEQLAVGGVTNMYSIVEKLNGAAKVIKP